MRHVTPTPPSWFRHDMRLRCAGRWRLMLDVAGGELGCRPYSRNPYVAEMEVWRGAVSVIPLACRGAHRPQTPFYAGQAPYETPTSRRLPVQYQQIRTTCRIAPRDRSPPGAALSADAQTDLRSLVSHSGSVQ